MSRRNYPVADLYEEREREFYRPGPRRSTREYEDLDVDITRSRQPDFMREDYGRSTAGALVVSDRREVDIERSSRRGSPPQSRRGASPPRTRTREVEKEEVTIREERVERPRRRERSISRDEFSIRRSHPDLGRPRPREVETEETDITIRRSEREERPKPRPREIERDEISIRRSETERPAPPRPREVEREEFVFRRGEGAPRPRTREVEKEEIIIRRDESSNRPPPRREVEKEEITIRHEHDERSVRGRDRSQSRDRITIRERSRGPARERSLPPHLLARETEEFVIRRRRPPSPSPSPSPPRRKVETEQITIRRTERSPTPPPPPPEPETPPPPVLQPIIRPPIHQEIHQEIITHHRHIDHGKSYMMVWNYQQLIPISQASSVLAPPHHLHLLRASLLHLHGTRLSLWKLIFADGKFYTTPLSKLGLIFVVVVVVKILKKILPLSGKLVVVPLEKKSAR
jgi:hypothetical protein